jgi:hypothetical protein
MNYIRVLLSRPKANRLLSLIKYETIVSTNEGQDHHIPRLRRPCHGKGLLWYQDQRKNYHGIYGDSYLSHAADSMRAEASKLQTQEKKVTMKSVREPWYIYSLLVAKLAMESEIMM